MVSIKNLQQLREETGISIMECKKALEEANDDIQKAKDILREKGQKMVKGKDGRSTGEGIVASYIHPGAKMGVLLELRCETDFVAKSREFQHLAHEICLQITATRPQFVSVDDIPEAMLEKEKEIYHKQFEKLNKPQAIVEKIINSKLEKYKKEISLLTQPWVRDESKTISNLVDEYSAKLGEKIKVARFARYEI
ncbi:elongation factor Ts [bacterium]|nr:elongation factor Ts [bacterium]